MKLATAPLTAFIATTQAVKAKAFFGDQLGLRRVSEDDFALVFDANGVELRVQKVAELRPQPFTVLGWQVSDIDATVEQLATRGIAFERFPGMSQDGRGIWAAPSGARVAWFRDPDGNLLSVAQYPTA